MFGEIVLGDLPSSLRSFVLFEDFHEHYDLVRDQVWSQVNRTVCSPLRKPSRVLSRGLARFCADLETLAVSFFVDANIFFEACSHDRAWQNLKSLSLTSPISGREDQDLKKMRDLLRVAASASQQMPRLHTLELWYGRKGVAWLFRYQITSPTTSKISWRGTWEFQFSNEIAEAWQQVALRDGRQIDIETAGLIDASTIRSHGEAISALELDIQMAHPVSIYQIRREAYTGPDS